MADNINFRVTPALDPETYLAVDGVDDDTRGYVDDVISFANDAYATLGKLHAAREAADSNPAWTPEQKVLMVSGEAAKQKARLARRLDTATSALDGRIAFTEGELLKPVQQGAAGPLAAEVRAHFKTLASSERANLIREAMDADDEATLQAVLGAQPFLSGLNTIDRDHFIRLYHEKKQPHLVTRLNVMKRVRDLLNNSGANGAAFHRAFEKAVGATPGVVRGIETANQRALDALKIEPTV